MIRKWRTLESAAAFFAIALGHSALMRASCPGASPASAKLGSTAIIQDDELEEHSALIVTADFNGDGIPDIAKVVAAESGQAGNCELSILLGQRNGTYEAMAARLKAGNDPRSLVVGDFNADGVEDLIVGDDDGSIIELMGDGRGNFSPGQIVAHFDSAVSIAVGDFNKDGKLDLAVEDARAGSVIVLLGSGAGSFRRIWSFALRVQGKTLELTSFDFNGDGIPDLVITGQDEDSFEVMTGNGNGTFTYAPALSHLKDPNSHCVT